MATILLKQHSLQPVLRQSPRRIGRACVLAAVVLLSSGCSGDGQPEDTRVMVRSMVLQPAAGAAIGSGPTYAGTISSSFESQIAFRVPGRVIARNVDVGDSVGDGAVLARLDPAPFNINARSADAAVAAARAELAQAEGDVARNAPLAADKIVAAADMSRLLTQRDAAAARLRDAQARSTGARDEVSYASLRAPAGGVVTAVSAEVGQYVAPGQAAFTIAKPGSLDAVVDVPESIVASLRTGGSASIVLASSNAAPITGRIREIAPAADPATRTYRVKISVGASEQARLGMTARVTFNVTQSEGTVAPTASFVVPRAAIANAARQLPAVWVIGDKGQIALRPVTLGSYAGTNVTILGGVRQGERIVTAGVHRLDAGQSVRLWSGKMP